MAKWHLFAIGTNLVESFSINFSNSWIWIWSILWRSKIGDISSNAKIYCWNCDEVAFSCVWASISGKFIETVLHIELYLFEKFENHPPKIWKPLLATFAAKWSKRTLPRFVVMATRWGVCREFCEYETWLCCSRPDTRGTTRARKIIEFYFVSVSLNWTQFESLSDGQKFQFLCTLTCKYSSSVILS